MRKDSEEELIRYFAKTITHNFIRQVTDGEDPEKVANSLYSNMLYAVKDIRKKTNNEYSICERFMSEKN